MANITTTYVRVPKKRLFAFGGEASIREKWGDNIDVDGLNNLRGLKEDEIVEFTLYETIGNRFALNVGEELLDCMVVVEDREYGTYNGFLYQAGEVKLHISEGYGSEDGDNDDEDEDELMTATENKVWGKLNDERGKKQHQQKMSKRKKDF